MRKYIFIIFVLIPLVAWGQEERKHIREGYKAYMDEDYTKAEIDFRKAEDANYESYIARYNTSTALYQQNKLEESAKGFSTLLEETENSKEQAKLLYNLGNVMMEGKQYQQAVDAYKGSMKINPDDEDTRYNLAYALEKLREQQQQEQKNQNQENQDQKDQQDKQEGDQQNQDQQEQKDQDQKQKDQEQQQENQEQQKEDQKKAEQQKQQMSQEEAERLLNAILQKEKDVKEKVDKKKATAAKIKTDKDW